MKRTLAIGIAAVAMLAACAPAALAQTEEKDPRLVEIIDAMKAQIEAAKSMEMEMVIHIDIPGQQLPPFMANGLTMNMWRDGDMMRMEMAHMNMVMLLTADEMTMYQGMANVALHVEPEALKKFKDQQAGMLQQLGLPENPDEMMVALFEKGVVTIAGEQTIDGIECWQLDISPESMEAMMAAGGGASMFGGMAGAAQGAMSFNEMVIMIEKETTKPKLMRMGMVLQPANGVEMQMNMEMVFSKVEYDVTVPPELFTFEIPEGVNVIEWTADKDQATVMQEFQAAALQGAMEMQQQQQQQQ